MKILFVSSMILSPEKPILNPVIQQQAKAIRDNGHVVDILFIKSFVSKLEYFSLIHRVFKKTVNGNYDIVHAHYGLSAISTSFRWKTPLVLTLHGSDALLGYIQPAISRFYTCFSSATIGVSKKIVDNIPGSHYIPCGVDIDLFRPQSKKLARLRLGLRDDTRYILFPYSPLRKVKRYDIALETVDVLKRKGMKVELLVVANQLSTEMVFYYNASDAMIMCSDSEGSPTAVKEALACNIPVISVDVGDTENILSGIGNAKLFKQSPEHLAIGFESIFVKNSEIRWESRTSMKRFSLEKNANKIIDVYRKVLK